MNTESNHSRPTGNGDVVVTYSRVATRGRTEPSDYDRPTGNARGEPAFEAFEVRPADPHDEVDAEFSAGGWRAEPSDMAADFIEGAHRSSWSRFGIAGASLAVIGGVGILAATVGLATIIPGGSSQNEFASSSESLAAGPSDSVLDFAPKAVAVREISMPSATTPSDTLTTATAAIAVEAPIPRPRPDDLATQVASEPSLNSNSQATTASAGPAVLPPPAAPEVASIAPVAAPAPAEKVGTDGLITSIEETLARIDDVEPAPPVDAAIAPAAPPVLPPPATESPLVMTQPIYPPPADIAPPPGVSDAAPLYDVAPPPAMVGGTTPRGPIPPEPVPQAYPQAPQAYPQGPQTYPEARGGIGYPVGPYAYPPAVVEETETEEQGLLRRTFAKATGAVGRVFTRN